MGRAPPAAGGEPRTSELSALRAALTRPGGFLSHVSPPLRSGPGGLLFGGFA